MTFGGHCGASSTIYARAKRRYEGLNDVTRDTNKIYVRQKSLDYRYYQYTRPNRTNSFKLIRKQLFIRNVG